MKRIAHVGRLSFIATVLLMTGCSRERATSVVIVTIEP